MTSSRELVRQAILFEGPERLPYEFTDKYGSDLLIVNMNPSPDARPKTGPDEWGAVWENVGICNLGQVKDHPLKDWKDFDRLAIPDIRQERRWRELEGVRERAGDKFLVGVGLSLYERAHFIRGLENVWLDIYDAQEELGKLLDILVEMDLYAVERYAALGMDGIIWCDDWGLQNRLMISPAKWHEIWKERYGRVYQAAHEAGMLTFLHSCGQIVDILDDLIDAGLDVVQMDQQENMGLELLGERFGGRITFFCPVDIQAIMPRGDLEEIRGYVRRMVKLLGRPEGGFIARWYADPVGAGHSEVAVEAMCEEFIKVGAA